jgi:Uncharacterised nucleotidyltransferase
MTETAPHSMPDGLANNLVLEAELRGIARAFAEHGIDLIVLKGIPFARRVGRPLPRHALADNDLLVRRADALAAHRLLEDLGYESFYPWVTIEGRLRDTTEMMLVRTVHGARVVADFHWSVFSDFLRSAPESVVWGREDVVDMGGTPVTVLGRPMTLLQLSAHWAQHEFAGDHTLENLATAWNLWGAELDTDELLGRARDFGLRAILDYSFRVAATRGLLEVPPPHVGSSRAALLYRWRPLGRAAAGALHDYAGFVTKFALASPRLAVRVAARKVFASTEQMTVKTGLPPSWDLRRRYLLALLRTIGRHSARPADAHSQGPGQGTPRAR